MYIVADIGGTKMRIAGSDDLSEFRTPVIFDTPQEYEEGIELFVKAAKTFAGDSRISRVVIGLPGILNEYQHSLFRAPNLKGWEGRDIKKILEEKLETVVYLQNDTALVGLGESHFGAGKNFPILTYITVSTGVGGVRIVDGEVDESKYGFEPGHMIISINGETHEIENLISGTAVAKKYGKPPYEIKDQEVWDSLAKILSEWLYNLTLNWSPDCIVLGGSMFKEVGIKVEAVSKYLNEINHTFPTMPILKKAELGDLGGLYGGLAYLKNL